MFLFLHYLMLRIFFVVQFNDSTVGNAIFSLEFVIELFVRGCGVS